MIRYFVLPNLALLAACGGTSTDIPMDIPEIVNPPVPEEEVVQTPINFEASAFDQGFDDIGFSGLQAWANAGIETAGSLAATDLATLGSSGAATYSGLIQLDYNGYTDGFTGDTYLVASALGKMILSVEFFEFSNVGYVAFEGSADSFVRNDDTPLDGEYELEWIGPITTDEYTGRSEDFVIYMDGQLSAGDTQYSGDANMYLNASGEGGAYLSGRVGGELEIWDINAPLEGTIYGNTTGNVIANRN